MNSNTDLALFRPRSSGGAISCGYRLYTSAFRSIFRASWPVALVYSLATALTSSYFIAHVMPLAEMGTIVDPETMYALWRKTIAEWAALVVLFWAASVVLASYGFSAMRQHLLTGEVGRPAHWYGQAGKHTLGRLALTALWLLLFGALAAGVVGAVLLLAGKMQLTTLYAGAAVVGAALFFLMLPLAFTAYRSVLAKHFSLLPPVGGYLQGLSHLGMLFVVVLVTGLFTLLLTVICQLPAIILYAANIQSQLGVMHGDEPGMPQSMGLLSFVVFALAAFIQGYIQLSTLFPLYYVYGTLTKESEDRMEARANMNSAAI